MRGDFSRVTFDPLRHFSRVLCQQGRLQLDADFNEQSAILLHYLRTLAQDLIGEHGGPVDDFKIDKLNPAALDFSISQGRYYVNGVLCENDAKDFTYEQQNLAPLVPNKTHLVYLDVWERHVSALDDDSIRDVALGQADTTSRAQVMWKVRAASAMPDGTDLPAYGTTNWDTWWGTDTKDQWLAHWQPGQRGTMKATSRGSSEPNPNPCIISPTARYRGLENQLYRVEIHHGGAAGTEATFKWSRDNGSVTFALKGLNGDGLATLASPDRGDRASLRRNEWVEIIDDDTVLRGDAGLLAIVVSVQPDDLTVKLKAANGAAFPVFATGDFSAKHVQLRRWDYRVNTPGTASNKPQPATDGALKLEEDKWLALEDGVMVMFARAADGEPSHRYRQGDYWLVPARTASGVEWSGPLDNPDALPPRGVEHWYAPLAVIEVDGTTVKDVKTLRREIKPVANP